MEELSATIKVETCKDCPYFNSRAVNHWLAYPEKVYEYTCKKENRIITPSDGVKPRQFGVH